MPGATQIIGGREYVYIYKSVWNKEKQRSEQKRQYIGRIVDGDFVPNKAYLLDPELQKLAQESNFSTTKSDKEVIQEITSKKHSPIPFTCCKRSFAGTTYLFDKIGEILGIEDDLKSCFPRRYKEMLSLAYFLALEPTSPLYRFKRWSASHDHPCGKDIPSQRSSEILPMVTESAKMEFLRSQAKRHPENDFMFYDSTSISSYSEQLKQVKYGKNKDGDKLAQLNLSLLLGRSTGLPAYYRKIPGNITDVMTIKNLLAEVQYLDLKKISLAMDRGYYSKKNINELFKYHYKFLVGAKISLKFIEEKIEQDRSEFTKWENYDSATGLFMKSYTINWEYEETKARSGETVKGTRRMYLHIYFNEQKAIDARRRFSKELAILEEELRTGKREKGHEKKYATYFNVTKTPVRGIKIELKQEKIDEKWKNYGYFALLSNEVKDPAEAVNIYRSKDMIEKAFENLKDRLNMRRTVVSSEENMEGKLFLQYIALIYLLYIKYAMDKAGLFKKYTMQELFDELDVIEIFKHPGKSAYYGEITEKQRELYVALGVEPPT